MASLTNAKLAITSVGGSSNVKIEASVKANFTAFELALFGLGLRGRLNLELWGEDGTFFNGGDDELVDFTDRIISKGGTQTFTASIPRKWLDEDVGGDEIYAKFTLSSTEVVFPISASAKSSTVSGSFG